MEHATITGPDFQGFVSIETKGKQLSIRFTWSVLARLQDELGEDFISLSSRAIDETKIKDIAFMAAAASSGEHDLDGIYDLQMPIVAMRDGVARAWQHAFFGGILEAEEAKSTAKKIMTRLSTFWRNLLKRG